MTLVIKTSRQTLPEYLQAAFLKAISELGEHKRLKDLASVEFDKGRRVAGHTLNGRAMAHFAEYSRLNQIVLEATGTSILVWSIYVDGKYTPAHKVCGLA